MTGIFRQIRFIFIIQTSWNSRKVITIVAHIVSSVAENSSLFVSGTGKSTALLYNDQRNSVTREASAAKLNIAAQNTQSSRSEGSSTYTKHVDSNTPLQLSRSGSIALSSVDAIAHLKGALVSTAIQIG